MGTDDDWWQVDKIEQASSMTSKNGGRKNLGTVVELSETSDDVTSPLIAGSNAYTPAGYPRSFDLISPSGFAAVSLSSFSSQPNLPRKRLGPLAQTRISLFNFLNSVAGHSLNNRTRNSAFSSATPAPPVNVIKTSAAFSANHASSDSKSRNLDSDIEAGLFSDNDDSTDFFAMAPAELSSISRCKSNSSNNDMTTPSPSRATATNGNSTPLSSKKFHDCLLCCVRQPSSSFRKLTNCAHRSCRNCLSAYLGIQIMESRVNVSCPECPEPIHQNDIYSILHKDPLLIEKYESFSLRRTLLSDPDARWCPAPDCTYAVIASYCAACPQLECQRPGCNTSFCYHCKGVWHDRLTCDEARKLRIASLTADGITVTNNGNGGSNNGSGASNSASSAPSFLGRAGDVKACPRCRTFIVKVDDGSCNHMVCAMCGAEFCWLCLKVITDLHYLSPTGCTFWGKRPWTRKKKLLWQIGTLIGAPVGIALIAGLAVPGIIFGVPVFIGRKTYQRFPEMSRIRRRVATAATIAGALIVSPVLAVMAVGVGVPIMLAYVYGVVPLSLCRNGGCGGNESDTETPYGEESDEIVRLTNDVKITDIERSRLLNTDGASVGIPVHSGLSSDVLSHRYNRYCRIHIDDGTFRRRTSVESGITSLGERGNFDRASVHAMSGSHYDKKSVHTVYSDGQETQNDETCSTKALAGSIFDAKSLTDSVGRHGVVFREVKEGSSNNRPAKVSTSHPSMYPPPVPDDLYECCCSELLVNGARIDEHHEGPSNHVFGSRLSTSVDADDGQVDLYKVHALMDNIKQILNDEAADEPPTRPIVMKTFKKNPSLIHPPSSTTRPLRIPGIARTALSKSGGTTVSAQVSEEGAHVVIKPTSQPMFNNEESKHVRKPSVPSILPRHSVMSPNRRRSFFARLFRRNKPSP